jgi:uncharacterized protein (DUF2141 family)
MKYFIFVIFPFFIQQPTVKVVVQNVQPGKGSIIVSIYNDEKDFLKKPMATQTQKANQQVMEFLFDIPPGEYAIAVYQDLNDNKQLDASMFHIPKEPYGFSNNYRPSFSAPHFKDCLIRIAGQTTSIITLITILPGGIASGARYSSRQALPCYARSGYSGYGLQPFPGRLFGQVSPYYLLPTC